MLMCQCMLMLMVLLPGLLEILLEILLVILLVDRRRFSNFEVRPRRCQLLRGQSWRHLLHSLRRRLCRPWNARCSWGWGQDLTVPNSIAHGAFFSRRTATRAVFFAFIDIVSARAHPVPKVAPLDGGSRGITLHWHWRACLDGLDFFLKLPDAAGVSRLTLWHEVDRKQVAPDSARSQGEPPQATPLAGKAKRGRIGADYKKQKEALETATTILSIDYGTM